MVKKTIKRLNGSLTVLKNEFKDLKKMYDELYEKCERLEKKDEASKPECNVCDEAFSSKKQLMRNNKTYHAKTGQFDCANCEKSFNEEWKLDAHKKVHVINVEKVFNMKVLKIYTPKLNTTMLSC